MKLFLDAPKFRIEFEVCKNVGRYTSDGGNLSKSATSSRQKVLSVFIPQILFQVIDTILIQTKWRKYIGTCILCIPKITKEPHEIVGENELVALDLCILYDSLSLSVGHGTNTENANCKYIVDYDVHCGAKKRDISLFLIYESIIRPVLDVTIS